MPPAQAEGAPAGAPFSPSIIDETRLKAFRDQYLDPDYLLSLTAPGKVVLVAVPVGGGKSVAGDKILLSPRTYERFGLVIYLAPTWAIINERTLVKARGKHRRIKRQILKPRPAERCGPLDAKWRDLEKRGCSAYARETLCKTCPRNTKTDRCPWPLRFRKGKKWEDVVAVLGPEQHLVVNRNLIGMLKHLTDAEDVLVILDEAQLIGGAFEVTLTAQQLQQMQAAIADADPEQVPDEQKTKWHWLLEALIRADDDGLADQGWWPLGGVNGYASEIQEAGLNRFGKAFAYCGFDLTLFACSKTEERWRDAAGNIRFIARPYLQGSTIVLSAHLRPLYVADRLRLDPDTVIAPFDAVRFRHTATTISVLKSRIGMEKYFYKNSPQIHDFFAALVARNILAGKTTVLVSRKDDKAFCATEMAKRLKALGITATFPTEDYDGLGEGSPSVVPVIHYGMVGVNTFEAYDACYCLNSYYVPDEVLNTSLMEHEPARYKVPVRTEIGPDGNRRVVVADPAHALSGLDVVGNAHLRKLEVDPAIQAVGRVRFFTKPREVIFFQMHDLEPDVGPVTEWRSLAEARAALGVPKMAELKRASVVRQLRTLVDEGLSIAKAAEKLGVHKETARRWLSHDGPGTFLQLPTPDPEDHADA